MRQWLITNVLSEIPIFGSFFEKKNIPEAVHAAVKRS